MQIALDPKFLAEFEKELDPLHPEHSPVPAKVMGYGEISTVLSIDTPETKDFAFKRMPMFLDEKEAATYESLYDSYIRLLEDEIGIKTVPSKTYQAGEHLGKTVVYIVQAKLEPDVVGQNAIHKLSPTGIEALLASALTETKKIFDFNAAENGAREAAIDGQISNWSLRNPDDYAALERGETVALDYLDTSTPLLRVNRKEQLETELFLRSAPSFLVWFIRWAFLSDVVNRYYDFRSVAIDMIANFYKEQRAEVVPQLIARANAFFADAKLDHPPITEKEVKSYYKEDAMIWRIYLGARKIDRGLHKLFGKPYPYVLPANVKR